jgi:hypothetical protein
MRLKTEQKPARISGLRPECLFAMSVAKWLCYERGIEMVITSVAEGQHSPSSRHYTGQAFDMRRHTIPAEWIDDFCVELRKRLGDEFDVVVEPSHIHVECDPKKGLNL